MARLAAAPTSYAVAPMAAAPPPNASAPPPVFRSKVWVIALLLVPALGFVVAAVLLGWPRLLFAMQMLLLTIAVCLTPILSSLLPRRAGRLPRAMLEITLFTAIVVGFYFWLWGGGGLTEWILYPFTLILIIDAGGHLVEWNKCKTIARLSKSKLFTNIQSEADAVEKMFRFERLLYLPLPLGLIAGTIWGLLRGLIREKPFTFPFKLFSGVRRQRYFCFY